MAPRRNPTWSKIREVIVNQILSQFLASLGSGYSHSHPAYNMLSQAILAAQTVATEVTLSVGGRPVCRVHKGQWEFVQDSAIDTFDTITLALALASRLKSHCEWEV